MEQSTLIQEAGNLIDAASDADGKGEPEIAKQDLVNLLELLTNELVSEAPAEPDTPAEPTCG